MIYTAIISLISLVSVNAKVSFLSKCDTPSLVEPFDLDKYVGVWYEIYKDPHFIWEKGGKCTTAYYTENDDGTIGVYNSQEDDSGTRSGFQGTAKCASDNGTVTGDCEVSFFKPFWGPYQVVLTDYD